MAWRSRSKTRKMDDDARTGPDVCGRRLTAQQKDERRQGNGDEKRLARHHPRDLLRSLTRERIGGEHWARRRLASASSFAISNFPCAPREAPDPPSSIVFCTIHRLHKVLSACQFRVARTWCKLSRIQLKFRAHNNLIYTNSCIHSVIYIVRKLFNVWKARSALEKKTKWLLACDKLTWEKAYEKKTNRTFYNYLQLLWKIILLHSKIKTVSGRYKWKKSCMLF